MTILYNGERIDYYENLSIDCSYCDAPLISILVLEPAAPITTTILATCPYCNDSSFQKTYEGKAIFKPTEYTTIVDVETDLKDNQDGESYQNVKVITGKGEKSYGN